MGQGHLAAQRRNIYDAARATLAHAGQHGQHGVQRSPEVHGHGILKIAHVHVIQRASGDDAGIVYEHINRPEAGFDFSHHGAYLHLVGEVAGKGEHVGFGRAGHEQVLTGAGQLGLVAGADGHAGPLGHGLAGQHEAQPARAAGDEHHAAAQVVGAAAVAPYGCGQGGGPKAGGQQPIGFRAIGVFHGQ